jgi:hypothetical protein
VHLIVIQLNENAPLCVIVARSILKPSRGRQANRFADRQAFRLQQKMEKQTQITQRQLSVTPRIHVLDLLVVKLFAY